jgi:4-diphosphocytidyl-2-C-methyl-D-erythritol kinase
MICFPNAKINLGLNVIEKRPDGFHNIETIFYPINWHDALEIIINPTLVDEFTLFTSGFEISGNVSDNIMYKAYQIIKQSRSLPSIEVHIHKALPMGAGLGGGSSDAAFFINLLNEQLQLHFSETEKIKIASQLGSDCAFFLKNTPTFASQKGDVFSEITLDLSHLHILVIYPNLHSNTQVAYSLVKPKHPSKPLLDIIKQPIATWKTDLTNDFEASIFNAYPIVEKIKNDLYSLGAIYASMSGSGSAIFGLFESEPPTEQFQDYLYWSGKMR